MAISVFREFTSLISKIFQRVHALSLHPTSTYETVKQKCYLMPSLKSLKSLEMLLEKQIYQDVLPISESFKGRCSSHSRTNVTLSLVVICQKVSHKNQLGCLLIRTKHDKLDQIVSCVGWYICDKPFVLLEIFFFPSIVAIFIPERLIAEDYVIEIN